MRYTLLTLAFLTTFWGCRNQHEAKRPYQVYPQKPEFFKALINPANATENLVTVKEDNYPIELKLFDDGRFTYRLKKLGDGAGKWKFSEGEGEGYIDLYAERSLFVMQMQIRSTNPADPEAFALEFSDRFGPKYLTLETRDSNAL